MDRAGIALVMLALGIPLAAAPGCAGAPRAADVDETHGRVALELQVGNLSIASVRYTITGSNGFVLTGLLDVSASPIVSGAIGGILVGAGYTMKLDATSTDGSATCAGQSGPFVVAAQSTTVVSIALTCQPTPTSGSVLITGGVNQCPVIDVFQASPAQALVGGDVALTGLAHDPDAAPGALSYRWTSTSGTIGVATGHDAVLTCSAPGTVNVTLTVSDGSCDESSSFDVICLTSTEPVALVSDEATPFAIAVDATNVYWSTADSVRTMPLAGGDVVTLASGQLGVRAIAVDATSVYWAIGIHRGTIAKAPLAGGPRVVLASAQPSPMGMVLDDTNVYWTNNEDGTVMKVPLAGGAVTMVASTTGVPVGIAVQNPAVYWTDQTNLLKVPLAGGPPVTLAPDIGATIGVQGSSIFWITSSGRVMSVPTAGGTPFTLASFVPTAQYENYVMAVDATNVYWVADDGGTVSRVPLGGGLVTNLAFGQASPHAIALDASNIYWTNFADGTVMKLAK